MKRVVDEGKLPLRVWMMLARQPERLRGRHAAKYRVVDYGDKRFTVRSDQARDRRRARIARRVDARAVRRSAVDERDEHRRRSTTSRRSPSWRSSTTTRWRSTRSAIARNREVLNIYEETFKRASREERQGSALADRARAAPQRRRHPALRPARRHRVDGGHSRHLRRAVRAGAPRARSAPRKAPTCGRS